MRKRGHQRLSRCSSSAVLLFSILSCLAATGSTLRLASASAQRAPRTGARRSRLVAQLALGVDEEYGQAYGVQVAWILAPSDTVLHEYSVRNGEEQTLGRFDMASQDLYVSRAQCRVRVAADGTASVVSLGKPPTYVFTESERPPPGDMLDHTVVLGEGEARILTTVVLRAGQEHTLQDCDQIAYRQARFTAYQRAAQGGWVARVDEASGQWYYYNEYTGASQWEQPPAAAQLPPGWVAGIDEASGRTYYYDERTGASQWECP